MKQNRKTLLLSILIFSTSIIIAGIFEDYYKQLVRFSLKYFSDGKIQFFGKYFKFPNLTFALSFGISTLLAFLLLRHASNQNKIKRIVVAIIIFFVSTISFTALDSSWLIIECTACDEGIKYLNFNLVSNNKYFIFSMSTSLIFLFFIYLADRKRIKKSLIKI